MGGRYEAVKELEPIIRQVIEQLEPEEGPDEQERMKKTADLLETLDRRSLWIIETVREVGFSGRGCRILHTSEPGGFTLESFPMPIEESVDELLERYAKLLEYRSKKEFVIRLARYRGVAAELKEGLQLLGELYMDDRSAEEWPEPAPLEPHPGCKTEIVLIGIVDDNPWAYALRQDLAQQLPQLQSEFDRWRGSVDRVSPFHQMYEEYSEDDELIDRGYRSQYGPSHFIDWLNAQYGQYVGWETQPPKNLEGLTVLNF